MNGFFSASSIQQDRPVGLVPRCGACGLFKGCATPKMPVQGKGRRKVLLVGEAPESSDDASGLWFTGKHGSHIRNALERCKVDVDEDAWMTGALICRTKGTPEPKNVLHCRPNLLNALETHLPRVVVPLGRAALSSVLTPYWKGDVGQLERWTGWTIPGPDFWICPTYHPSQLAWAKNDLMEKEFTRHLKQAFAISEPVDPFVTPKVRLLYEPDELQEVLPYFCEQEWVAVDYESNCLKPEYPDARVYSCALSDGRRTVSFPWNKDVRRLMEEFFCSPCRKIASNLKFEERWTRHIYGHGVRNWGWDTMLAAHCLDNRPGICSLKFQAWVKLGVPTYNEIVEPYLKAVDGGHYNRIHQVALDDLLLYGGMDAVLEYQLAMRQREEMGL